MSNGHALLAPSAAGRWVRCAGSVSMEARYPELEETPEAAEGTAAHWAASQLMVGQLVALGQVAPNGVVLTAEMVEGAELYVEALLQRLPAREWRVEQRVNIPYVHPVHSWGTPDAYGFAHSPSTGRGTFYVGDYKFGHDFVEVFENWQLLDYLCGILDSLGIDGHADQHLDVEFIVVQPRSYHRDGPVRTWRTTAALMRGYFNQLQHAANLALGTDPLNTVNVECKNCRGRHACEAFAKASAWAVDTSSRSIPLELPPAALGLELRMLKRAYAVLKARISGLEEIALPTIKSGVNVPFFQIEQGYGRQAWSKPIPEVIALGQMMNVDVAKQEAITPNQAIKAGIPAEIVALYSHVPKGSLKLVEVDDTTAKRIFSK